MADQSSWKEYEDRIAAARSAEELAAIEHEIFSRKSGTMTLALKELQTIAPEQRRTVAQELNEWKKKLEERLENRKKELASPSDESLKRDEAIDVTLELPGKERGHLHLIPEFIRKVEEVFGRMGFDIASGPEIETEEFNFNLLNIPRDHPARDMQDTFWIKSKNQEGRLLLRTQTSPMQVRYMQSHKPPLRVIAPGKVYRKDSDATHSPMFHQFEGLMIGKDITLANMKAVMITAIRELTFPDAEFRFRTGFFPFVEPGLEVDMRWRGDEAESREGRWLEVVGCGMVHPNVLKNCGIDPKKWQGFAFGFGVERMIMIKHQIPDLRSFYQGDLRFLRQF
ncbi:MAG: phenylalanine--tRNA ligase subunit alpha [Candidatus Peribacteraceae bacterium]|nr:phenylalanine--tRNA ligase subunit alpha [Candidatus Peribacteraceae bacterium]MDD5074492.1 phenylalanine--tRNA ligase subunit alpha [Candidatus Peribacteraceae bacterium]